MSFRNRMMAGVIGMLLMVGLAVMVLLMPHYRITDSAMVGTANPGAEVYLAKRDKYLPGHVVTLQYGGDVFTRNLLGYQSDGTLVIGDASNKPEVHPGSDGKPVALSSANIIGEVVLVMPRGREVTIAVFFVLWIMVGWCFLSVVDFGGRSSVWATNAHGTYPR